MTFNLLEDMKMVYVGQIAEFLSSHCYMISEDEYHLLDLYIKHDTMEAGYKDLLISKFFEDLFKYKINILANAQCIEISEQPGHSYYKDSTAHTDEILFYGSKYRRSLINSEIVYLQENPEKITLPWVMSSYFYPYTGIIEEKSLLGNRIQVYSNNIALNVFSEIFFKQYKDDFQVTRDSGCRELHFEAASDRVKVRCIEVRINEGTNEYELKADFDFKQDVWYRVNIPFIPIDEKIKNKLFGE